MASVVSHTVRRLILPRHPLAMATKCSVMLCLTAMLVSALAWWSVLSSFGSHRVRATREWPRIQIALAAGQDPGKLARCSVVVLARGEFPGVLCKPETAVETVNPSGTSSGRRTPQESAQIRIGDSSAHRMAQDNSQTPLLNGSPQHDGLQGSKFEKSAVTATITSFVKQNDVTGANPPKSGADHRYQDGISRTSPGAVAGRRNPGRPTVAMWKIAEAAMEKLAMSDDLLNMGHNKTLTFAEQMRFNGLLRLRNRLRREQEQKSQDKVPPEHPGVVAPTNTNHNPSEPLSPRSRAVSATGPFERSASMHTVKSGLQLSIRAESPKLVDRKRPLQEGLPPSQVKQQTVVTTPAYQNPPDSLEGQVERAARNFPRPGIARYIAAQNIATAQRLQQVLQHRLSLAERPRSPGREAPRASEQVGNVPSALAEVDALSNTGNALVMEQSESAPADDLYSETHRILRMIDERAR